MTQEQSGIIDVHVHLAALPEAGNGCFISQKMLEGPLFRFVAWKLGLDIGDPAQANRTYVARLAAHLDGSRFVSKAVLLGMDGVYGSDGRLDERSTEFLISNDHVLSVCRERPDRFLAGVSINPLRRDAVEELGRCAAAGAALVKVLPNAQGFDPADERCRPFYRALAQARLPFLSHVGFEFSLIGRDQSAGDPARLRMALDEGVTVIAAHGASQGLVFAEPHWNTMQEFCRRYSNFYWDASALSLPNRFGMLLRLRRRPELLDRMLFGTDYPLPVFAFPALRRGVSAYARVSRERNPFDRQAALLMELGMKPRPGLPWASPRNP